MSQNGIPSLNIWNGSLENIWRPNKVYILEQSSPIVHS